MTSHNSIVTCLSSEDHKYRIKEHLLHYLGCLEFYERNSFFDDKNDLWKDEIDHQVNLGKTPLEAEKLVSEKRVAWKSNCDSELRRIDFLRKTLSNDNTDRHLIAKLEESRLEWHESTEYKANIDRVRRWRVEYGKRNDLPPDVKSKVDGPYEPEKDVNVPIMEFENSKGVDEKDSRVWGKFPNQKTTLAKLFDGEPEINLQDSLLYKDHHTDRIRYFHIPANNMKWAEETISRYFGDKIPDYEGMHRELQRLEKTKTYMMLSGRYWRSQLHGYDSQRTPPHARYMRPLCTTVSSSTDKTDYFPNNVVLFMPYLHWDTSRKREQFAAEIDSIMTEAEAERVRSEQQERADRRKRRGIYEYTNRRKTAKDSKSCSLDNFMRRLGLGRRDNNKADEKCSSHASENSRDQIDEPTPGSTPTTQRFNNIDSVGSAVQLKLVDTKPKVDNNGRVQVASPLGRYLLDAARLYEGMANYRDKMLLRKYLPQDPPMHPRRTLDQAFYWTLNSTRQRDRDQVVYRGTTALPDDFHSYDAQKKVWIEHEDFGIKGPCSECKANIQKVSRVVMVDQLWMWILDEKTIITCFPKRYGANKHDSSGVHKSIRLRLQDNGPGQIRSVFDLALIIIDECSNTFFDRTKTIDRQPQVIDAFSKAIGNIMHKQTAAFERLWRWTDEAGDIYRSRSDGDTSDLHVPLLDINPEGKLEREIKDIIEELDIMLHITKTHRDILKNFMANAGHILDPLGTFDENSKRAMTSQNVWKASRRNEERRGSQASGRDHDGGLDDQKRKDDYHWFKINADERYASVVDRIEELEELRSSAVSTANSVKDLLELKQQQASVVQAWQSVKQSEEAIKQGRSIMMFTLVTIVFLPLSFLSSIFGMNNIEFSDNSWRIRDEIRLMFTISAGVIFLSLLFAFSGWIRAGIWYGYKWASTVFLVRSGLYDLWLDRGRPSKSIHRAAVDFETRLKAARRKARFARRRARRDEEDRSSTTTTKTTAPANNNGSKGGGSRGRPSTNTTASSSGGSTRSAAGAGSGDLLPPRSARDALLPFFTIRSRSRGDGGDVEAGNG